MFFKRALKIALQNKKTRYYCTKEGQWTADLEQAVTFKNTVEAEKMCKQLQLEGVWIVLKSDGGTDTTLPCCS